jgi:hypothetical protein
MDVLIRVKEKSTISSWNYNTVPLEYLGSNLNTFTLAYYC